MEAVKTGSSTRQICKLECVFAMVVGAEGFEPATPSV